MKVMSIIGIVVFSIILLFIIVLSLEPAGDEAAANIAIWGILYGLSLSIVGVASSAKQSKSQITDITLELTKLSTLKDKGIISEEEFIQQKNYLLYENK